MSDIVKRPVKACVFDLGNTLVNDTRLANETAIEMGEWLAVHVGALSVDKFVSTYQRINYGMDKPFISHTFGELEFFERTFQELTIDAISARTALEKYRELLVDKFHRDSQVVDVFRYLIKKGIRIALLSNERTERVDAYLEKTDLSQYFDAIIVSEAIGVEKPDLRIFQETLNRLNIQSDEMIMFGDNEIADGACVQLGIFFVLVTAYKNATWVWEKGNPHKPGYVMEQINREQMRVFLDKVALNF